MDVTKIFYHIDNFCKFFEKEFSKDKIGKSKKGPNKKLKLSEIMTIMVLFHHSKFKTFKDYYKLHVLKHFKNEFPRHVSYNRFIELKKDAVMPLFIFAKLIGKNKCTGISYIDSTSIKVCHTRRESSNKTFKGIAEKGKTSVGWFFGFKLHITINERGEIIDFILTPGNVSDANKDVIEVITKNLRGRLFGDKGYLGQSLFKRLFSRGVKMITKIKKNMKNKLIELYEKLLLKKRGVIESVIGILKEDLLIEHSRHRSTTNFMGNIASGIIAYFFRDRKPHIKGLSFFTIIKN